MSTYRYRRLLDRLDSPEWEVAVARLFINLWIVAATVAALGVAVGGFPGSPMRG